MRSTMISYIILFCSTIILLTQADGKLKFEEDGDKVKVYGIERTSDKVTPVEISDGGAVAINDDGRVIYYWKSIKIRDRSLGRFLPDGSFLKRVKVEEMNEKLEERRKQNPNTLSRITYWSNAQDFKFDRSLKLFGMSKFPD